MLFRSDIVIEITIPRGAETTRRRNFSGVGRYPRTLETLTAELNPEGTDYALLENSPTAHAPLLSTLQSLLAQSAVPLTCRDLLDRWPGPLPRQDSLWRVLGRGVELGLFTATGKGTKTEPFQFALVARVPGEEKNRERGAAAPHTRDRRRLGKEPARPLYFVFLLLLPPPPALPPLDFPLPAALASAAAAAASSATTCSSFQDASALNSPRNAACAARAPNTAGTI